MALINGALQIGRSALLVSQAGLAVTGNNMANAATPSYSRQTIHLSPTQHTEVVPGKFTGTGVALTDIRRQVDDALNARIRNATADSASNQVLQQAMSRVEAAFNELTEQDLSTQLNSYFQSWSALQNQPQDMASRSVVLQQGQTLTAFIRSLRSGLTSIQSDMNEQLSYQITQANSLVTRIADLNQQVVNVEAGNPGSAAALRDQRDELLRQLSELVNITSREVEGGSVNVFIGNDPLIQHAEGRILEYVEKRDAAGNWASQVVFTENNQAIDLQSGKMHGYLTARDDQLGAIIENLDTWTGALIYEVNKLHSLGSSLTQYTSVVSNVSVDNPDASLADTTAVTGTGLPWQAHNGVFNITITDSQGITSTYQISVNVDTSQMSLNDLVAAINDQLPDQVTAAVDSSNRLTLQAASGFTFGFSGPENPQDASDILAVLGINTFFQGSNSADISVKADLTAARLAAGANGLAGNGDIARQIAELATAGIDSLDGESLGQNFTTLIAGIAADTRIVQDYYTAADVVVQTLEAERQAISGVSIDEEAIHMITFQRAFQGAARFINMVDEMLEEIIALV